MSEREKQILETIATAIPKMSDFDKGYLLGMGEAMVRCGIGRRAAISKTP